MTIISLIMKRYRVILTVDVFKFKERVHQSKSNFFLAKELLTLERRHFSSP
jgi:hypothetical protein